jgi:predicted negative regulator of RcsB-dependent stress response
VSEDSSVDVYATDDEKVEALKKWWKENGKSLLIGVAIGLIAVFGWRAWVDYRNTQAQQASAAYEQMMLSMSQEQADAAIQEGEQIISRYSNSPYAVLTALAVAKLKLDKKEPVAARSHLQWAMEHAGMTGLQHVARIRLARVMIAQGEDKAALKLISGVQAGSFAAEYDELRGDIYRKQGEDQMAASAYQKALGELAPGSRNSFLLQMKLNDLTGSGPQDAS